MGRFVVTTCPASEGTPQYSDDALTLVLDVLVRQLVTAEAAVRAARVALDEALANARRHGQQAQVVAAEKRLAERRLPWGGPSCPA
jgi:hypothetical protein